MSLQEIFATRASRMKASEIRELLKLLDQPDIISFAGGIPDAELFPKQAFQEAFAEALSGPMAAQGLQYSTSEGHKPLRVWIAKQMQNIGIPATPDNILITSGSQQALDYLGKLFLSPGDTALVGWPTYLGALGAFNAYEPRYDKLDPLSNRSGADYKAEAEAGGGKAKFANPTGATVSRAARERVIDLADEIEIAVIEDAAYQSLRFDGEAIPPILALEAARKGGDIEACRTIYCGSFSKTLSPGLRVGWVCAAMPVISQLVLMKQAADLHSATLNQIAITQVAEQHFDSHVATIGAAYSARRNVMLNALEEHMPDNVSWTKPEGGMFIWVTLPEALDGADLLAASLETERVAFVPGHAFFADGSGRNTLRLSYATSDEAKIAEGIKRLGNLVTKALAA
jgi:DNA-binding transcriptional MocR family regulator